VRFAALSTPYNSQHDPEVPRHKRVHARLRRAMASLEG
jgi:hypothetical protein